MRRGRPTKEHSERIDLGLALLSVARKPGVPIDLEDMAAWCDCHYGTIQAIERKAIAKIRPQLAALFVEHCHFR